MHSVENLEMQIIFEINKGFNEIIIEIVKKFWVHICIFQSTADDQYQGGPDRVNQYLMK